LRPKPIGTAFIVLEGASTQRDLLIPTSNEAVRSEHQMFERECVQSDSRRRDLRNSCRKGRDTLFYTCKNSPLLSEFSIKCHVTVRRVRLTIGRKRVNSAGFPQVTDLRHSNAKPQKRCTWPKTSPSGSALP
jgi:hypothetical protein